VRIKGIVGALAVGLANACAPSLPMAPEEAERIISALARGERAVDICTPDGARIFRRAVRIYADTQAADGRAWPNFENLGDGEIIEPEAVVVAIGFVGGIVRSGDLRGESRTRLRRWALENLPDIVRVRGAADDACTELAAVQVAGARYARAMQRRSITSQSSVARARHELEVALHDLETQLEKNGVRGF